ncbi:MAG: hypothetical protein UW88_C0008G0058 [Candidatus Collierbacteria bacterium GW2011_GWD2_45_10]|nr:MAG: hypothetical protein UW88_C0008G0058 [Candidatus Collierbacteria bacterium GW2011_GWD2_45_10]
MIYDLSILIPSRNEMFLSRTIEDILVNIEGNTEIIVGLDGLWAEPPIKDNPRVRIFHVSESIGQRAMTNQLCRLSNAKYIMKVDAHCAFDKGFDVKMMNEMHDDWTMVPVMRNLHAFNWVCPDSHIRYQGPSGVCTECGKETVRDIVWIAKNNPQSTSYCFDPEPHFQYFNEFKKRPEGQGDLTETMSLQGSCFMLTKDKYWELNICDENFGSWRSQGIEVAVKTWLSGGRVIVNHNTWYAHMFRTQGGDFGFPYELTGSAVGHAKKTAKELFFKGTWEKQVKPLSWLVEKFMPVPGWKEEDLAKLKETLTPAPSTSTVIPLTTSIPAPQSSQVAPTQSPNQIPIPLIIPISSPTIGCIYYTDNLPDEKILRVCQKQLKKAVAGKKIVSVSLKPIDFGENIVLPLERGYLTMFKQILAGLEALDTDIVFFCEHDVLYHPTHFDFRPSDRNVWYYDGNYWFLRASDGFAIHYNVSPLSGLCVYRDIAIKHYKERIAMVEKEGFSYRIGFEPMTHGRIQWKNQYKFEVYQASSPSIDISHGKNVTSKRWTQDKFRRKPTIWKEANIDTIPGWDNVRRLLK